MGKELLEKLTADGWVVRSTASGVRLQEIMENYQLLGFEVKVVPARELAGSECNVCLDDPADPTKTVLTRKTARAGDLLADENENP